ncbi:MAG: alpha-L-rhamnosidase C-terminal domain-containing protein, partial [Terriglobia bacterium]
QGPLKLISLEGKVVHTAVEPAGQFGCSNELFNRIFRNARWSQLSNMHCGVPSDCPHRERLGYTGDGQIDAEAAIFNFDMAAFYTKWIDDMHDAQNPQTGFVPHTAPFEGGGGGPPWGSACVIIPWLMHLYYADRRILDEHYSGMRQWVEYLRSRIDDDGLVVREEPGSWCLGDWSTVGPIEIPPPLVDTCYYAHVAQLMARTARVLARVDDAQHFSELTESAKAAVNTRFFNASLNQYHDGRQGANVFPLAFGLVPEERFKLVLDRTVDIFLRDNCGHFDTGMFGTPLALDVLTAGGRPDVAYTLMNQTPFPGYGFEIGKGATTLWERWDGIGSHNHAMFGSVVRWFYKSLAGINPDPENPGFKNIVIRPCALAGLTHVTAEYLSIRGKISSRWRRERGSIYIDIEVPAGSTATLFLPADSEKHVQVSGTPLRQAAAVKFITSGNGRVVCATGSGRYRFEVASDGASG